MGIVFDVISHFLMEIGESFELSVYPQGLISTSSDNKLQNAGIIITFVFYIYIQV